LLVKNVLYLSTSSYGGGYNDQFYYGDFTTIKCITGLFDSWKGWKQTGYFSTDTLLTNRLNGRYEGVDGDRIVPEELFYLSVLYAVNTYGITLQFFPFRWILHPARKNIAWTQEIETAFRTIVKYKFGIYSLETIRQSYNHLFQKVFESDVPNEILYEIDGIMWPAELKNEAF
jgi:hypothetical protein